MKKKSYTIAIAGKGGSGKTTVSALILRYLLKSGKGPILAVDADPNVNLNEVLSVKAEKTVVSTMDEIMDKKGDFPAGVTKERCMEYKLNEALVESSGFDLLVMGQTEGPGCYCYANNLLRSLMDKLSNNYTYVVMDNEAGMEHLSRRTTRNVDVLLIIANNTYVSLRSAKRINETASALKLKISKIFLLINELFNQNFDSLIRNEEIQEKTGLGTLGTIPYDEEVNKRSIEAKGLLDLDVNSPSVKAVKEIMEKLEI